MSKKLNPVTILYVEHDDLVKYVVEIALEEAGFHILTAACGMDAVRMIEAKTGDIRGLVTDIDLGIGIGPTGWDVARRARELVQGMPVIYVSGASAHDWTSEGVPDSVMIAKPFAPAQVIAALSSLLTRSAPTH